MQKETYQTQDTDKLEKVIVFAGRIKTKIEAARADGKVTGSELLGLLPEVMGLPEIIEAGQELKAEQLDLDIIEIIDLSEHAITELVPNESQQFKKAFKYSIITTLAGQVAVVGWIDYSKQIETKETPTAE